MGVRLPAEYQEVEYISGTGTQYIDSGIECTSDLVVDFDFLIPSDNINLAICGGIAILEGNYIFRHHCTPTIATKKTCYWYGYSRESGSGFIYGIVEKNIKHNMRVDPVNGILTLDGISQSISRLQNRYKTGRSYGIFGRISGTGEIQAQPSSIYAFKFYRDNELIGDFVPCHRKLDSKPGMYDLVTKQFFTNAGTGEFIVGPNVRRTGGSALLLRRQILMAQPHKETVVGDGIATFDTDFKAPMKVVIPFTPVQADGTPSPGNSLPISGWTGCNSIQRGQNLVDGTFIKDIIFNRVATSRRGESPSGWVWFQPNQSDGYPTILGVDAADKKSKYKFKENTAYTICFTSTCQSAGNLNIGYTYTDETYIIIAQDTTSRDTHRIVTDDSKTLKNIWIGNNIQGWTSIYYPTFCVCEGDVALEDIPTQQSAIVPITFTNPSTGNPMTIYGGTVTLNEDGSADVVSEYMYMEKNTSMMNNLEDYPGWKNSGIAQAVGSGFNGIITNAKCNVFSTVRANTTLNYGPDTLFFYGVGYTQSQLKDMGILCQFVIPTINPVTYHFPNIGQLKTFLGENNIWSDLNGDPRVTFWKHG